MSDTVPQNKVCAQCRFFDPSDYGPQYAKCRHYLSVETNLVTGERKEIRTFIYCDSHRTPGWLDSLLWKSCGKRGRFFEPNNALLSQQEAKSK